MARLQSVPIEYLLIATLSVVFVILATTSGLTRVVSVPRGIVKFFDVGTEANLWTWANVLVLGYAALALLTTGVLRWLRNDRGGLAWMLGAVVVAGLSLDDLAQLHENTASLGTALGGGDGLTHFAWIVPGTVIAAFCIAALAPAMMRAKPAPRRLLVLGTVFLFSGAIGFEAVSGDVLEYTKDGLSYAAYDVVMHVEELLEALGATFLLGAGVCDLHLQKEALAQRIH
jgi:hypothetical protein